MKNFKRGFTLLEVMVTIGIFGLVLSSFMVYYTNEIRQYYSKENRIELRQSSRIALDRVADKIRYSAGLVTSPDEDGPINTVADYEGNLIVCTNNLLEGDINYDADKHALVDKSRNKIVGNITDFSITREGQLLTISVTTGNTRATGERTDTTAVRLH